VSSHLDSFVGRPCPTSAVEKAGQLLFAPDALVSHSRSCPRVNVFSNGSTPCSIFFARTPRTPFRKKFYGYRRLLGSCLAAIASVAGCRLPRNDDSKMNFAPVTSYIIKQQPPLLLWTVFSAMGGCLCSSVACGVVVVALIEVRSDPAVCSGIELVMSMGEVGSGL